jgi:hypothetical protein
MSRARLQLLALRSSRWVTPATVRSARLALMLAAVILAAIHPGVHIPHVLADGDDSGP